MTTSAPGATRVSSRPPGVGGLVRSVAFPVIGLLVGLLTAVLVTDVLPKSFQASASVVLVPKQRKSSTQTEGAGVGLALNLTASVARLAESRAVAEAAAGSLGLPVPESADSSSLDLLTTGADRIEAAAEAGNQIVTITTTAGSAARAAELANAVAAQTTRLYARLKLSGTSDISLQQLDVAAPPVRPIRPQPLLDASLGALAGLLIGIGARALARRSDDRFTAVAQIEAALGLPSLGLFRRPLRPRPDERATLVSTLLLLAGDRPLGRIAVTGIGRPGPARAVAEQLVIGFRLEGVGYRLVGASTASPDHGRVGPQADAPEIVLAGSFRDLGTTSTLRRADAVVLVVDSARAHRAEATRIGRLVGGTAAPVVGTVVTGPAVALDGWRPAAWSQRGPAAPVPERQPRSRPPLVPVEEPVAVIAPIDRTGGRPRAAANGSRAGASNGVSTGSSTCSSKGSSNGSSNGSSTHHANGRTNGNTGGAVRPIERQPDVRDPAGREE